MAITPEFLRELLDYDPETGVLTWKLRTPKMFRGAKYSPERDCAIWNTKNAGKPAFSRMNESGYLAGKISKSSLKAHRVIWMMVHGEAANQIDHINGDRADNRLANLRNVDHFENHKNMRMRADNTTGVSGVAWDRRRGKWQAKIGVNGQKLHLGRFTCIGQAVAARKAALRRYGFHKNHGVSQDRRSTAC